MDIAFVNQPLDMILPPVQNSLGRNTYQSALRLGAEHRVRVFGGRIGNLHDRATPVFSSEGVDFHFLASDDAVLARCWPHFATVAGAVRGGRRPQMSASRLMGYRYVRKVASVLAADPPDVVHVRSASQFMGPLRRACPDAALVLSVHAGWYRHMPVAALARRVAAADVVTACSGYVARTVADVVPAAVPKLRVVYNGVDTGAVALRRRAAGRRAPGKVVLHVGILSVHKGVHDLIRAFVPLARQLTDIRLRLVGPVGNYGAEEMFDLADAAVRRDVRRLYRLDYVQHLHTLVPPDIADRVEFAGPRYGDDLWDEYLAADVFVSPAIHQEGFGRPVIEAMAAGLPVVATRSGGMVETVEDGRTGVLVDRQAPEQIEAALEHLLGDEVLRRRLGDAAERSVADRFDWDRIARDLARLYEGLLLRRRTTSCRGDVTPASGPR